jgi:multicomponent Na+:H+ antiporter subunit E
MTVVLSLGFRLLLWVLLTGDTNRTNLVFGLLVAILLPRAHHHGDDVASLLKALWQSLVAIPQAYGETVALILAGGDEHCDETEHRASGTATPLVVFLDLLAITLTPFTLVLDLVRVEEGMEGSHHRYRIHRLRPAQRRGRAQADGRSPQ